MTIVLQPHFLKNWKALVWTGLGHLLVDVGVGFWFKRLEQLLTDRERGVSNGSLYLMDVIYGHSFWSAENQGGTSLVYAQEEITTSIGGLDVERVVVTSSFPGDWDGQRSGVFIFLVVENLIILGNSTFHRYLHDFAHPRYADLVALFAHWIVLVCTVSIFMRYELYRHEKRYKYHW